MPTNEQRRAAAKRKLERQMVYRQERAKKRRIIAVVSTVVVVALVGGGVWFLATNDVFGNGDASASETPTQESVDKAENIPTALHQVAKRPTPLPGKVSCEYTKGQEPAAKQNTPPANGEQPATGTVGVTLGTSIGDLKLTLDRSLAPCTVNNFVELAKQKYFDNTTCHRLTVTGIQVLQCGDPGGNGMGGPGYSFKDETYPELSYGRGVLAMANSGPNTNGSQFFIVYGDAASLKPDYTVFGTVDEESLKKVDEVAKTGTISQQPGQGDGKPKTPVDIKSALVAN
ncbi:peptidylprolyl isomerase [Lentzea jiangxiensis]|uniref:Peptidyl-prolyl cis-trans isomerase n=1 Tax=Lentzea jiangxiensis TaxID=641025 RepID=A0A1H0V3V4_9PSEU|nr:peptidylprolyl isomerase [Lentzea jiangxiensis]SDP73071.1 peptidyl-prolyl cis-trans isomerase B (cyclophilin B) [Lentzea jiangxiensis]